MLVFILIIIVLLVALRIIVRKPAKVAMTTAKVAKVRTLTRHDNAIMRSIDRTGW